MIASCAAAPRQKPRSIAPKAEAFLCPPAASRWSSRSCAAWGACRSARSFGSNAHSPALHFFPVGLQREACPSRVLVARRGRTACTYLQLRDSMCLCSTAFPVMRSRVCIAGRDDLKSPSTNSSGVRDRMARRNVAVIGGGLSGSLAGASPPNTARARSLSLSLYRARARALSLSLSLSLSLYRIFSRARSLSRALSLSLSLALSCSLLLSLARSLSLLLNA